MGKGRRPATHEDIQALPAGWVGEILEDELVASPHPTVSQLHSTSRLSVMLGGPFCLGQGGPGGWWIILRPELHLGRDILVPDLAGWRRERMPRLPSPREPFMTLAPDWVCEVLSPCTVAVDRARKLPRYHREGVRHVWLVDPLARTLAVLHWESSHWRLLARYKGSEVVHAEPFEVLALRLEALWLKE